MRYVDPVDGQHIVCCWDDCQLLGDTLYECVVREPYDVDRRNIVVPAPNMTERWKKVHFLFCSERHRAFWANSHKDLYQLPPGSKGLLAPRS